MKPAALLGRLKVDVRRLRPSFGWLTRLRRRGRGGGTAYDPPPPKPLVAKALTGAVAVVVLGLGGLAGWLYVNREATTHAWEAAIPTASVTVKGGTPPKPMVQAAHEPAAAPHAAPADPHAAPAPADAHGAPTDPHAAAPGAGAPAPLANIGSTPPPLTDGTNLPLPSAMVGPVVLTPAPVPGLIEDSRSGPLPRIADDGRKPWQVYARPFPMGDKRPRIAIVMAGMGVSGVTTGLALDKLPPAVTLAFVPYAERLDDWVQRARTKGHEVMLSVPMEPQGYPQSDPGPNALLTMLTPDRITERLDWSLGRAMGYVGITSTTGSRFTASEDAMKPVIAELRKRGLLFLDARVTPKSVGDAMAAQAGLPHAYGDRVIDTDLARGAIDDQLKELENAAKTNGAAVGMASPYPSTIERINLWLTGLSDRGFALAPVSAVVNLQKPPAQNDQQAPHR